MINLPQDGVRLIFDPVFQRLKVCMLCVCNYDNGFGGLERPLVTLLVSLFQIIEIYNMKLTKLKYWCVGFLSVL